MSDFKSHKSKTPFFFFSYKFYYHILEYKWLNTDLNKDMILVIQSRKIISTYTYNWYTYEIKISICISKFHNTSVSFFLVFKKIVSLFIWPALYIHKSRRHILTNWCKTSSQVCVRNNNITRNKYNNQYYNLCIQAAANIRRRSNAFKKRK